VRVVELAEVTPDRCFGRNHVRLIAAVDNHVVRALLQPEVRKALRNSAQRTELMGRKARTILAQLYGLDYQEKSGRWGALFLDILLYSCVNQALDSYCDSSESPLVSLSNSHLV